MVRTGQLQEAKKKLNRVVENAVTSGPQIIRKGGREVAVVVSYAEYQQMMASREPLSEFFRCSPLAGVDLDLGRDRSTPRRDVEL